MQVQECSAAALLGAECVRGGRRLGLLGVGAGAGCVVLVLATQAGGGRKYEWTRGDGAGMVR